MTQPEFGRMQHTSTAEPTVRQNDQTWMINGQPGQIITLVAECAAEAGGSIETITKGKGDKEMTYKGAEAIKKAARILGEKGIATTWETSEDRDQKTYATIRVTSTWIAPDGSYLTHSIVGGAYGTNGRQLTVALTAAVKHILALGLQMVAENETDSEGGSEPAADEDLPKEEWSDALHAIIVGIDEAQDHDELNATTKLPGWRDLSPVERVRAKQEGERRHRWLTRMKYAQRSK